MILIIGVLFYCKSCIRVEVVAKYRFSVPSYSDPQLSIFKCFFEVYNRSVERAFVFKKIKRKGMEMEVEDPGGPISPAAGKKDKQGGAKRNRK